jgi:hypothetical protein
MLVMVVMGMEVVAVEALVGMVAAVMGMMAAPHCQSHSHRRRHAVVGNGLEVNVARK